MADRNPLVQAALDFQKLSSEAFWMQRQREDADLEFQVPEKQWPENVQVQRAGQTVQGVPLPPRPMLSIPSLQQPIQQVFNQWSRAHFGVHISPKSQEATDDTAEVIQGLYRQIEVDSRAYMGRGWALDRAIKAGFGGYRVDVVYDEDTDDPDDLKIVIKRVLRQSSIYWDPFAVEPDFCDQRRCLLVSWISREQFKRDYPKAKMSAMDADELLELQSQMPNFAITGGDGQAKSEKLKWYDGANDAVCVAEFFYTEWEMKAIPGAKRASKKEPVIKWCKLNAVEVLEEQVWNGKYIPIIPVIGNELQPFDTERRWQGLIGPNKDAARLLNYEVTAAVEKDALSTKAPWIGYVGQFKTNQQAWAQANTRNFPYLEADPIMAGGTLAPLPQRNLDSPDLSSAIALIQLAKDSLQTGTAIVDSSALENLAKRKVAHQTLLGMQESNQISQSQYVQNMADISMTYEAKVILDLIPKIYDREGRVAMILGEDEEQREVMLNTDYTTNAQQRPVQVPSGLQALPPEMKVKRYDLTKGRYGVVVDVGKSYKTKAQEGADAFGNVLQADPNLVPILGDLWFKYQDFPGHKEAAERLQKMLPPQLQPKENEDDPKAIAAQRDQAAMMVEQLGKQLQEASKIIETDQVKSAADIEKAKIDATTKIRIAKMQAEAEFQIEMIKLKAQQEKEALALTGKAALQDDQQRHEHAESAVDRAHEIHTLDRQVELAEAQAENQAGREFAQGEVDHAHTEVEGERQHQRGMESQTQAEQAAERQAEKKASAQGDGAGE